MDAAEEPRAAVVRVAFEVTSAAFEEAMREHGILPDAIKVISADARANVADLDDVHAETLVERPQLAPPDDEPGSAEQ